MRGWKFSKSRNTDISAPGQYIYTAYKLDPRRIDPDPEFANLRELAREGNLYKFGGATSQATVHVAAAAAMWRSYYKPILESDCYNSKKNRSKIVEAFRYALKESMNTPDHWDSDWESDKDKKNGMKRKDRMQFKGILDAEKLLSPELAPNSDGCKKYVGF